MNYTQEQFEEATLITNGDYNKLENPTFEGQTRVINGQYKMYCSVDGKLYYTINKINFLIT